MREAIIPANIDISWLYSGVGGIQACPIATKVAQMPLLVDKTIFLLSGHFMVNKFGSNSEIENQRVFSVPILPIKPLLELATRSKNAIHREMSRGW